MGEHVPGPERAARDGQTKPYEAADWRAADGETDHAPAPAALDPAEAAERVNRAYREHPEQAGVHPVVRHERIWGGERRGDVGQYRIVRPDGAGGAQPAQEREEVPGASRPPKSEWEDRKETYLMSGGRMTKLYRRLRFLATGKVPDKFDY